MSASGVILSSELTGARGGLATAAAVAVALAKTDAGPIAGRDRAVLLAELAEERGRGPTMLAADSAREVERRLREAGLEAAARGRLAWLRLEGEDWPERLRLGLEAAEPLRAALVHLPPTGFRAALEAEAPAAGAALLRADLPAQRSLAALAVVELRSAGLRVRVAARPPGRVAARRALAGIDPGGEASHRAARLARGLAGVWRSRAFPARLGPAGPGAGEAVESTTSGVGAAAS
jgi:hypothetical protein